jgi:hypothetical protein
MAILDFLKVAKKAPAAAIDEMEASLGRLRAEMKEASVVVEGHGTKRADMLLSDASEEQIIDADKAAELAALKLERLELAEIALLEQIEAARDASERQRRVGEMESVATAIFREDGRVDTAASAFAAAYRELLSAVPADLIDVRILKPRFTVDGAATPVDIASAIAGQSLASHCPELFESHRPHTRTHGDACAKTLCVLDTDRAGRLSPILPGEHGKKASITSAQKAARRFVVDPLRDKARVLRGSSVTAEAAE